MPSGLSGSVVLTAVMSATCGSLAAVCGKIAFDTQFLDKYGTNNYLARGILVGLLVVLNSIMLSLYVNVLQAVSALQASLLAFVCNYLISTTFGIVMFGEAISLQWVLGATLMTAGALRVAMPTGDSKSTNRKKKKN
jgi:hypothetical protein